MFFTLLQAITLFHLLGAPDGKDVAIIA